MIIWKGWGILAIVIPLLCSLGAQFIIDAIMGAGWYMEASWPMPLALALSAVFVFVTGKRLNNRPGKVFIDPESNEKVELRKSHSLFWIPLQYWSPVIIILAGWLFAVKAGLIPS
ncbi:hypothetical protein GF1_25150 [Desulfolithobacter dissulfuricans]|uniref:Uncharacterized protein n=1 Tax=Desulfolithobacter dissulfuricans TaxID=2795293 RepID=A0A915U2G5_9BACT|nr:hypothetical protein [Desulfolithobacter dissulfuricans]BCO10139.1 hypothetical protein GF1_25150 [Desulfolithobacter dissulfuricans]